MKNLVFTVSLIVSSFAHPAETECDIVIYGSSPAAISAAVQAKRMGVSAVIVSPETRIGGLTTGGLGQTDIGNKSAFGGIALEFYRDVAKWYADPAHWTRQTSAEYRPGGQTAGTMGADSMWTFEPSAALAILEGWEKRDKLDIRRGEWLDREKGVEKQDGRIVSIKTLSGNVYRGKMYVDATYEGDLMAAAGVSYTVGREANSVYGETISGVQFREAKFHQLKWYVSPYVVEGKPESGLLPGIEPFNPNEKDGDGDKRVQAYNFRMCLTDDPENRIPFKKPANYDEREYELLFRNFAKGESAIPWINSKMPNRKTDTNNKLGFSTDFIGRNYEWPEATYERRAEIFKQHLDYQQGLMWTLANHPRVPEKIRAEVSRWGTCKDEFLDGPGDGWQSQLYVREARRMVGDYVMTEHECRGDRKAPHPVAMGAYTMDSHNVRRVVTERGNTKNEGDVEDSRRYSAWGQDAAKRAKGGKMKPYGIDYGAITPKRGECANLLVPVCLSASHMAFGSIRMEPVFFALGQAAGTAASIAVSKGVAVQDVPYSELSARLSADGQITVFAQAELQVGRSAMSDKYWEIWNETEQAKIDADIEANRKADATVEVAVPDGAEVSYEQISHDFRFGASTFNFGQLGATELNRRYAAAFGDGGIFNQGTVPFYWREYEPEPGVVRATPGKYEADFEEYWNSLTREKALKEKFWRRPSPGPIIDYLKGRGLRVHGHILVTGGFRPEWLYDKYCPDAEKDFLEGFGLPRHENYKWTWIQWELWTFRDVCDKKLYPKLSEQEIGAALPVWTSEMRRLWRKRVLDIGALFGKSADSWDVVNESARDFAQYGKSRTGLPVWKSFKGIMPGDFPLLALLDAKEAFPETAELAINENSIDENFLKQVNDLTAEGVRIDLVGCQMHIMDTNLMKRLAAGCTNVNWVGSPAQIRERLDMMARTGRRIHISEVTIPQSEASAKGLAVQAAAVRNLYRMWFSHKAVAGITWWNLVDGCSFPGEPQISGLFRRDMSKKPAYDVLDSLINGEWRTKGSVAAKNGKISFRGFKGRYRIAWKGADGKPCAKFVDVK